MAARNPSAYSSWIDESKLEPGQPILAATPDAVLNDQEYVLDQPVVVMSWCGPVLRVVGTGWTAVNYLYVRNKDMCDVAGVTNNEIACDVYVRLMGDGSVRLTSTNATANTTASAAHVGVASRDWVQCDTINIPADGTEDEILIELNLTEGETYLELDGILILAQET